MSCVAPGFTSNYRGVEHSMKFFLIYQKDGALRENGIEPFQELCDDSKTTIFQR